MATCEHGTRKSKCKPCIASYMSAWTKRNRARVNGYVAKKRERYRAAGLNNKGKPLAGRTGRLPVLTPEQRRVNSRAHVARNNTRVRDFIRQLLGGRCRCIDPVGCAGDDMRVIQIDHVHGDGFKHRKVGKGYHGAYKELRLHGEAFVRAKYQLLCANCHVRKTLASGDHRTKTAQIVEARLH